MPIFFTELLVHTPGANDLAQLQNELAQQSFRLVTAGGQHRVQGPVSLHFKRQAKSIHEVSSAVLKAVKRTGRNFSFTIIKGK
jgi:hypothetical protein